ncbi:hypothetical protein FRB96_008067 [Tulasnella sp. 330]|nr:hypothetical protein FRB96_008067 [Tulasnella sp. 330]
MGAGKPEQGMTAHHTVPSAGVDQAEALGGGQEALIGWQRKAPIGMKSPSITVSGIGEEGAADAAEEIVFAQSLLWVLENSREQDGIFAYVENIPTFSSSRRLQLAASSLLFPTFVEKFEAALVTAEKIRMEASEQKNFITYDESFGGARTMYRAWIRSKRTARTAYAAIGTLEFYYYISQMSSGDVLILPDDEAGNPE